MVDVQMDYDLMEDMARTFRASAQQLDETIMVMTGISAQMEDGALIGDAGTEFVDAIRGKFTPSVQRMRDKMQELEKDLMNAVAIMRDGVDTAASRFV
jgi:WXG100 family type VII secretion target